MTADSILQLARNLVATDPLNCIEAEWALSPELANQKMYEAPLMGIAAAGDPIFLSYKDSAIIGPCHLTPNEWLPEAASVISLFFPIAQWIKRDNAKDLSWPSHSWLHARIEGHRLLDRVAKQIASDLEQEGFQVVIPSLDGRFQSFPGEYRSNWSERHAAYAAGLGTFGLSKGLITEAGIAGRLTSIITSLPLEPTPRAYNDPYAYCTMCGACVRNCPAHAIDLVTGKNHPPCDAFLEETRRIESPRYGCGKCQVSVPCSSRIPLSAARSI